MASQRAKPDQKGRLMKGMHKVVSAATDKTKGFSGAVRSTSEG